MRRVLIVTMSGLLWAGVAHAQTCNGSESFTATPLRVGADLAFSSNTHTFGGYVTKGNEQYFVRGTIAHTDFDGVGGTSIGGSVGTERQLTTMSLGKPLFVCPQFGITKTFGPEPAPDFNLSELNLSFGASVGFEASKVGTATVIPTVGLSYNYLRQSQSGTSVFGQNVSASDSSNYFALQLGVGFVFNNNMSLIPSLVIPIHLDAGETIFSVAFAIKVPR